MIIIKDNTKIMASLLRSGHTMLNLSCPICNNPLFRNKDQDIFCPICNRLVIVEKKSDDIINEVKSDENKESIKKKEFKPNFNSLMEILIEKINIISTKLEHEVQIDILYKYIKLLNNLFNLLKKIEDRNASAGI